MYIAHELGKTLEEVISMPTPEFFQWRAYFRQLKEIRAKDAGK